MPHKVSHCHCSRGGDLNARGAGILKAMWMCKVAIQMVPDLLRLFTNYQRENTKSKMCVSQ